MLIVSLFLLTDFPANIYISFFRLFNYFQTISECLLCTQVLVVLTFHVSCNLPVPSLLPSAPTFYRQ